MGEISDFMREDHKKLFEEFSEYQRAKSSDKKRAKQIFFRLLAEIRRHFLWEEQILFVMFEERTGTKSLNSETSLLRIEHKEVLEVLDEMKAMLEKDDFETKVQEEKIGEIMKEHSEKEINIIYPWLDEAIGEKEATDVIKKMQSG